QAKHGDNFDDRVDQFPRLDALHTHMHQLLVDGAKTLDLKRFEAKGLNHADAGIHLHEQTVLRHPGLEARMICLARLFAENADGDEDEWNEHHCKKRELPIHQEQHDGDADDGDGFLDQIRESHAHATVQRLGVTVHTAKHLTDGGAIEEIE